MSAIEYEAKVLEIVPGQVAGLILDKKGGRELGEVLQRRYMYDIEPGDVSRWVRSRDTGERVTLTVKEIDSDAIGGTRETETRVGDFETTNVLLGKLGYVPKAYQKNRRHSFTPEVAELEIDAWPRIPAYLEIEAGDRSLCQAHVGTDPKTVARWTSTGRLPHRRNAHTGLFLADDRAGAARTRWS